MKPCLGVMMIGLGSLLTCSPAKAQPAIASVVQPTVTRQPNRASRRRYRYYDSERRRYVSYEYGKRAHVERIANHLAGQANALCWNAHRNYGGNRDFRVTYKEMYNLITGATHITKLIKERYHSTHHESDHIVRDLHAMDKLIDHLRSDVRYWVRNEAAGDPTASAPRPGENESILVQLARLEDTLHHLMRDYGANPANRVITSRPRIGIAPKPQ